MRSDYVVENYNFRTVLNAPGLGGGEGLTSTPAERNMKRHDGPAPLKTLLIRPAAQPDFRSSFRNRTLYVGIEGKQPLTKW